MSVTKDDVRKVARLSRIAVEDGRLDTLAGELNGILGWIDQLNEAMRPNPRMAFMSSRKLSNRNGQET